MQPRSPRGNGNGGNGNRADSVNIIIQATDKAGTIIKGVGQQFSAINSTVAVTQAQVGALTTGLIALGDKGTQSIRKLGQAINIVRTVASNPVTQSLFTQIMNDAEEALNEIQPLSEVLGSLAKPGASFLQGAFRIPEKDILPQIEKRFDTVAKKISGTLIDGFNNVPVENIPLINKVLSADRMPMLADSLDQSLSKVLLEKLIGQKIPTALQKMFSTVFGRSLPEEIAQNSAIANVLGGIAKDLQQGSVLGALENEIGKRLSKGASYGFVQAENAAVELASFTGKMLAKAAVNPANDMFERIDQFFDNELSAKIDSTVERVGVELAEKLNLSEYVRSAVGELTNLISGSVITGMTGGLMGGAGGQALFQLFADDMAAKGVKALSQGALVELGKKLSDITFLTEAARVGFENLFISLTKTAARNAIGTLADAVFNQLDKRIPQNIKSLFQVIEKIFPDRVQTLGKGVVKDVARIFGNIVKPITQSPVKRLEEEIQGLEAQAEKVQEANKRIRELQKMSRDVAIDPGLSKKTKDGLISQFNNSIREMQKTVDKVPDIKSKIADLKTGIEELKDAPDRLRQEAMNTALNPNLTSEQKGNIVDVINDEIQTAENQLKSPIQRFASSIRGQLNSGLDLENGADFFGELIKGFAKADDFLEGTLSQSVGQIGGTAGRAFAANFGKQVLAELAPIVDRVDESLRGIVQRMENLPKGLIQTFDGASSALEGLVGFSEPVAVFQGLQQGAMAVTNVVNDVTQQIFFFQMAIQSLQQLIVGGPFDLLIGQNVRLQEQLLATQSSLVATNQIFRDGVKIQDPGLAIQALSGPVSKAIEDIRKGSLELVGITSNQLIESFQIISQQASSIGISLEQAGQLTLSFASALGTLGIPMEQAREEISSIAMGVIDQNSVLAKSLGITNEMVSTWKQQGRVYDELTKRLEAFRAGNKLAAMTLNGVTSNIQELFEEIGRKAGEPLLKPIVEQIDQLYQYLHGIKDVLAQGVSELASKVLTTVQHLVDSVSGVFASTQDVFAQIPTYLIDSLANAAGALSSAVATTLQALQPLINVFAELMEWARPLVGLFLQLWLQFKVAKIGIGIVSGAFGTLVQTLPLVGELMFFVKMRSTPLISTFTTLTKQVGLGGAGFLLLGKNMNAIPGAAGLVTQKLSRLGALAPMITRLIPSISGMGIQVAGLARTFSPLGGLLNNFIAPSPKLLTNLAGISKQSALLKGTGLDTMLKQVAQDLTIYSRGASIAGAATNQFTIAMKAAGLAFGGFVLNTALSIGTMYAITYVIDQWILKNETFMAGLKKLGEVMLQIGKFFQAVIVNPFTQGLSVTIAVAVAINMKLIPALINMSKVLAVNGVLQLASALQALKSTVNGFSSFILSIGSKVETGYNKLLAVGSNNPAARRKALATELKNSRQQYKDAIAERQARLVELNKQIDAADPSKARITGRKAVGDMDALIGQRQAVEAEMNQMVERRKTQLQQLREATKQAREAEPSPMMKLQQGIQALPEKAKNATKAFRSSITDFNKGAQQMTFSFEQAGKQIQRTSSGISSALRSGMTGGISLMKTGINQASQGLEKIKQVPGMISTSFQKMGNGIQETMRGISAETKAFLVQTAVITAAFTAITMVVGEYARLQEISTKQAKDWRAALGAARQEAENYKSLLDDINNKGDEDNNSNGSGEDPRLRRLREIAKDQGLTDKAIEEFIEREKNGELASSNALSGDNTALKTLQVKSQYDAEKKGVDNLLAEANKYKEEMVANQEAYNNEVIELENLRNRQAEATARGDQAEADKLQEKIDLQEKLVNSRKDGLDAQIKTLETTNPLDAQQKEELTEVLSLLIKIRGERERAVEMKPPELLYLGGASGQLYDQAKGAAAGIEKMLRDNAGSPDKMKEQAEILMDRTDQLVQNQMISVEQARAFYQLIASNGNLEPAMVLKAQQAITETYGTETERRTALLQAESQKIDQLTAQGAITANEAERQKTQNTIEQVELRIESLKQEQKEKKRLAAEDLENNLKTYDRERAGLESKLADPNSNMTDEEKTATRNRIQQLMKDSQRARTDYNTLIGRIDDTYNNQITTAETEREQASAQAREQRLKQEIQDYEEAQAILDALKSEGALSDEEYQQKLLENTRNRLAAQESQLADERTRLMQPLTEMDSDLASQVGAEESITEQRRILREALAKATTQEEKDTINATIQGLEELAAREASIDKERMDARKQYYDAMLQAAQQDGQEQQSILEGKKAQGLVSEQEYADQSLANTNDQLDRELELIEQQRKELNANDVEGQEALAAKEGEINKRRVDAQQQYYDTLLAIAERARKKLLDAAQSAELDAQIATQELLNEGDIQQSQADLQRLNAAQERANREIEIEEQKLADLMAMPAFSDPQKEAERQQQIRDSRMRTQQLTLQIAEGEYRRQELIRAELQKQMDRQVQQAENLGQVKVMGLEAEQRRIDAINKTLDLQSKILGARQEYLNASSALLNAQLDVLGKTTRSQRDQREIAELRARVELRMLDQKQEMERQALQLQQEQLRLSLQREQAENRIAQIKNQAETAKAVAEYAKVQADPEATPEQIEAARLGVVSSMMTGRALQEEGIMLGRQGEIQESLFAQEEAAMGRRQQGERFTARGNYLDTLRGSERREYAADLQEDILNNLGMDSLSSLRSNRNQARLANRFTRNALPPASLTPDALPPIPNLSQYNPVMPGLMGQLNNPELVQALNDATAAFQGLQGLQVQQENQIINQFTGQDVNNGNFQRRVQQQTLNTLYGVADKLQQRRRLAPT